MSIPIDLALPYPPTPEADSTRRALAQVLAARAILADDEMADRLKAGAAILAGLLGKGEGLSGPEALAKLAAACLLALEDVPA